MTVYNTEKDSSAIKDPTSHTNTEAMLQCYAIIRSAFANILVANSSAPPFWQRFAKLFGRENLSTYGIPCNGVQYICMLWLSPNDNANVLHTNKHTNTQNTYLPAHLHVYTIDLTHFCGLNTNCTLHGRRSQSPSSLVCTVCSF